MTHAEIARQIREAIFDQAEIDGRVMHASSVEKVIEGVLAKALPVAPTPAYSECGLHFGDAVAYGTGILMVNADGEVRLLRQEEWR